MEEEGKPIKFYIDMAFRRKWSIIIPLAISIVVSYGYYKYLPKIYKATTVILVQPQMIPESYVRPTVTTSVSDQLSTLRQEVLSRTRLEKVIRDLNLHSDSGAEGSMEEIVETMKKSIDVDIQRTAPYSRAPNTFSISYQGKDPQTVMLVTNQLAALFTEEHLKARELQAEGTSVFLGKELIEVEKQLTRKEVEIKNFRERNMGKLPEQLNPNLNILERLHQQLAMVAASIKAAEDRGLILQTQIEQLKKSAFVQVPRTAARQSAVDDEPRVNEREAVPEEIPEDPLVLQLNQMKRELNIARSKYTENHPDVVDLKRKIANLEPKAKEAKENQRAQLEARKKELQAQAEARRRELEERRARARGEAENIPALVEDPTTRMLLTQYQDQHASTLLEAERLRGDEKKLRQEIIIYQKRIEDTPKLEQELSLLNRDYDLLKTTYQSLKEKKIQSQMAENLEKKQQGEQFKVLDPARYPEIPVKPNRDKILMMGAFIGLAAGLGLAWFRETLDPTFHSEEELQQDLGLPILATLPNMKEERKQSV